MDLPVLADGNRSDTVFGYRHAMPFSDGIADFRSDTVTRPTAEMREAMAAAVVGDDVYGEDPTVNELQERCAEAVGHEAALFVPSGTMGNQIGVALHTRPGDGVVCVERAHVRFYEGGGVAANSGAQLLPVPGDDGVITPDDIAEVGAGDPHLPRPTLLTWENTHNLSGGTVVPIEIFRTTSGVARERGWAVHLDGARIFNASAAAGLDVREYTTEVDTVQFCLSKGLGAPVGSIIAGSRVLIDRALSVRKRLGGGMRQAGVIAAPALLALDHRHNLVRDHHLASRLAAEIASRVPGAVDASAVVTNMVVMDAGSLPGGADRFLKEMDSRRVNMMTMYGSMLRFVTHRDVDDADVDRVIEALDAVLEGT